ncbi:MAG: hypothetical protein ACRDIA_04665, partial [Actinomycetota bacterium]
MQQEARKRYTMGFGAIAVVLACASAAMACTTFLGVMTVTGTNTVTATGNANGMGWCNNPKKSKIDRSGTFSITIGPYNGNPCGGFMANQTMTMRHVNEVNGLFD